MIKPFWNAKEEWLLIRLIATDLDGTLLEPDGKLPEGTFAMVRRLVDMGIHFAASSGRESSNLMRLFGPVADQMAFVCLNGALNFVDGQLAGCVPIPEKTAREIIRDVDALGMNLLISGRHTCYMVDACRKYTDDIVYRLRNTVTIISHPDEITEPILKISGQIDCGVADLAPGLLEKWGSRVTATVSGRDWFDFTAANKGMGVEMLMKHMGLVRDEVMVFGDNFNDESMFGVVDYPFLMEHANPALRKPGIRLCKKVLPVLEALIAANGDPQKAFN